ncbi:MAG: TetR/AcrR family transcriptional regulator [Gammaproteobacteria bacterium]|nr:TetR/AcrR family transcriptional regulator [Gammaproteobacteria bacterium]
MSTATKFSTSSARDRILEVATDLFYRQGYRATGINEVIDKSGVAKATFYKHFPSKDELYEACLKVLSENELCLVDEGIRCGNDPHSRLLAVLKWLETWAVNTDFRGCAFLHAASEVPDHNHRLRKVGTRLYDEIRHRVEKLAEELVASDTDKYGQLDAKVLASDFMVLFSGAVAMAELYHGIEPIRHAVDAFERLIGK